MPRKVGERAKALGEPVRVRLPDDAVRRIDALAARAYRERPDQLRYLLLLGLEREEERQAAADAAVTRRRRRPVQSET